MNDRLSQNGAGRLMLAGRTLKAGEALEVIVGGNWHHATVRKTQTEGRLWTWELILDTGRAIGAVGLTARLPESKKR